MVRGLAFAPVSEVPAHLKPPPPGRKPPPPGSQSKAAGPVPAPAFVVHDLMLVPSKVPTAAAAQLAPEPTLQPYSRRTCAGAEDPLPPTTVQGRGTELERHWQRETMELCGFLSRMQAEVERKRAQMQQRDPHHPGADLFTTAAAAATATGAEPLGPVTTSLTTASVDAQASMVLASVVQDMVAVDRVARAAELDMMTRLGTRRFPRGHNVRGEAAHSMEGQAAASEKATTAVADPLLCSETLPDEIQTGNVPNHDEMRKALISAARDAAIFRETARILRRKARELCDRRIKDKLNKLKVEKSPAPQPPPASRRPSR